MLNWSWIHCWRAADAVGSAAPSPQDVFGVGYSCSPEPARTAELEPAQLLQVSNTVLGHVMLPLLSTEKRGEKRQRALLSDGAVAVSYPFTTRGLDFRN